MDVKRVTELAEAISERVCWALDLGEGMELTIKDIVTDELLEEL